MKLDELFEVDWHVVAIFDAMLSDDTRGETFQGGKVDLVFLDEGFEVI